MYNKVNCICMNACKMLLYDIQICVRYVCVGVHVHACQVHYVVNSYLCVLCVQVCMNEYECTIYTWACTYNTYTKACTNVHM